jgi:hypothetical protein
MSNGPEQAQSHVCAHARLVCINPHELIRKYRCRDCGAVMMCACDEAFGRRFLSHQLSEGTELKTRQRILVTLGFQPKVCAECLGLPAEPAPAAEIHGRTSKIKRFYWRELFFEKTRRSADWDEAHPEATDAERRAAQAAIETQVLEEIKALHASAPKYVISEPSQAEVLKRYHVEVLPIAAEYVEAPQKGAVIRDGDEAISPEAFVTRRFEAEGWSAMQLESVPFHAMFGVMMWLFIQDSSDPRVRIVGFGDRLVYEAGGKPPMIWTQLPEDFGTEGYGERRKRAITRHFRMLTGDRAHLQWLFDYWRGDSVALRQYLWAHREPDVDRARRLIQILPPVQILAILRYLVEDYWGHYLGWPDLLLHRNEEILFLEVKSSGDRLSQAQKGWIADNHSRLHLPFKLVKLHRVTPRMRRSALSAS